LIVRWMNFTAYLLISGCLARQNETGICLERFSHVFWYFSLVGVPIKVIVILAIYREDYCVLLWSNLSDILAWKSQTIDEILIEGASYVSQSF